MLKKLRLAGDNFLGDFQNGILPLMNALDQKIAVPNLPANVFPDILGITRLCHQIFVGIANTQLRHLFAVRGDLPTIVLPAYKNLGHNILIRGFLKGTARPRIQVANVLRNILHLINPHTQGTGNLRKTAAAQGFHVIFHHLIFHRFHPAEAFQLQQQTFA